MKLSKYFVGWSFGMLSAACAITGKNMLVSIILAMIVMQAGRMIVERMKD